MTRLGAPIEGPAAVVIRAATLFVLLLVYPQPKAAAQESVPVGLGDRVRVTAPGLVAGRLVGTVLALADRDEPCRGVLLRQGCLAQALESF